MSGKLIKPYEVSIWEDEFVPTGNKTGYYREVKIATIGGDTMTSQSRIFSPILALNTNGEQTFTFSIKFQYYDEHTQEYVTNPLVSLLVNERKIKLKYDGHWYDFIIKQCEESSEDGVFTYTATDAFIDELSKTGYFLEFNQELNNNQGTAIELGQAVIKDTDWIIDTTDCDILKQTIEEGIYKCTVKNGNFTGYNLATGQKNTIKSGETIYVFYSAISNKSAKDFQFIRVLDKPNWTYDDHNSIYGTNYRYGGTSKLTIGNSKITFSGVDVYISIDRLILTQRAHKLFYDIKTLYDSVMNRTVDLYRAKLKNSTQDMYHYKDSIYASTSLVTSFITNGANFNLIDGTSDIIGWRTDALMTKDSKNGYVKPPLTYVSRPSIDKANGLVPLETLGTIRGFIRVRFPGTLNKEYANTYFNSGFMDHASSIGSVSVGDEYCFRVRYGVGSKNITRPRRYGKPYNGVKAVVAFYNTKKYTADGNTDYLKVIDPNGIIFNFNGTYSIKNNKITNGHFDSDKKTYIIDGVAQTPSNSYCYYDSDIVNSEKVMIAYAWDGADGKYKPKNETDFLDYYICSAKAIRSVTQKTLNSSNTKIGIFLYTKDSDLAGEDGKYVFLQEVEFFKASRDSHNNIVLPNSAPATSIVEQDNYYFKPVGKADINDISIYTSLKSIASELHLSEKDIQPVYNTTSEKILSIEESQSNCFNILQTICETFECWLKINVEHEANGAIKLDSNYKPIKKLSFKQYVGNDNFAGFRYGINLNSIERSIDSSEFVTKLIVQENASDFATDGLLTIANAKTNPSRDSYILNFDYYIKQGLIKNEEGFRKDLNEFYKEMKRINIAYQEESQRYTQLSNALIKAEAHRNVAIETQNAYQETYTDALDSFKAKIGISYDKYIQDNKNNNAEIDSDELRRSINDIYAAASGLNTYGGVVTNAKAEYKKILLDCEGAKEYSINVSTTNASKTDDGSTVAVTKLTIDDYVEGFVFQFERSGVPVVKHVAEESTRVFISESSKPYTVLHIIKLPRNYVLQYRDSNNNIVKVDKSSSLQFSIYDIENNLPMIRQFQLVPTDAYLKLHKGSRRKLEELLAEKKKVEADFNNRYSRFIKEGTWGDTSYIDANLYYLDALQVSRTSAEPLITYTINVTEISEIEGYENYKFNIGDKTYIEDTEFFGWNWIKVGDNIIKTPVKEEVIISGIEWHLEEPENNIITVQNYKTQFQDLFQRINATVQSVQYNQPSYSKAASILDSNGRISAQLLIDSITDLVMNHMSKGG